MGASANEGRAAPELGDRRWERTQECRRPTRRHWAIGSSRESRCRGAAAAVNLVVDDGLFSGFWALVAARVDPTDPCPEMLLV